MATRGQRLLPRRVDRLMPGPGLRLLGEPYAVRPGSGCGRRPLPEEGWTDIGMGEDATLVRYRPVGWEEQSCVAIRRRRDRGQSLLLPLLNGHGLRGAEPPRRMNLLTANRDLVPARRLSARGFGAAPPRQAEPGERLQLATDRPGPASRAVPEVPGQPALLCLRPTRADAAARGAAPAADSRHNTRRHGLRPLIRSLCRASAGWCAAAGTGGSTSPATTAVSTGSTSPLSSLNIRPRHRSPCHRSKPSGLVPPACPRIRKT